MSALRAPGACKTRLVRPTQEVVEYIPGLFRELLAAAESDDGAVRDEARVHLKNLREFLGNCVMPVTYWCRLYRHDLVSQWLWPKGI